MTDGLVDTCGVLLAAGGGSRMGQPKAEVVLGGQTLLERGLQMLADAGCAPLLCGGRARRPGGWYARGDVRDQPRLGERHGVVAARGAGCGDRRRRPRSRWSTSRGSPPRRYAGCAQLTVRALRSVATFEGEIRTPVLFDRALWAEVSEAVTGDAGARHWLRRNPARVIPVACDDVADPTDLDLPEDLTRWEHKCS